MNSKFSFITAASAVAVGAALVLSGCASHASTGSSSGSSSSKSGQAQAGGQGGQGGAGGFGRGTSGEIAQVSGSTLQVQSTSSQTAVTVGSSTKITKTVDVALSDVKVGDCITASTTPTQGSSGSSSSSSSSSSGVVTRVAISQAVNGSCDAGFGGRGGSGGTRPSDRPSNRPSGRPSNFPSGAPSGGRGGNFVAPTSGKVTAVSGSTITVDAVDFQTQKTSSKSVTVGASTKYTEQQSGTSSDLVVGQCVVAQGKADDSGTVAATAITVSAPVNGDCSSGFGGFGGRGGFGGGQAGSNGGSTNG